jgi:hypothetical protein
LTADPRTLLARLDIDPDGVDVEELPHNRWLTPGVWRIRDAHGLDAVLKLATSQRPRGETPWDSHWTAGDLRESSWTYWKREALAYSEGVVDACEGSGIGPPRCLAARVEATEALLLVEWVQGEPGENWPLEAYGEAARALGRAQAPFLAGRRRMPDHSWLSREYLRDYSTQKPVDWSLLGDDAAWDHRLARECLPEGLRPAVNFLHASRDRLYAIHDALPVTLCHLDFWPKNLIRQADGQIRLFDWSFVGAGSVGEDVGNLVPDASFDHFVPAAQLPNLDEIVFEAHLDGLRQGGWAGDARLVQLGMWSSAVKYDWLAPFVLAALDQEEHHHYGGGPRVDPRYRFSQRGQALLFNAGRARQALELAAHLGL